MNGEDVVRSAAFLGTDGGVCFSTEGFDKALQRVGENTGNTLFQRAMWDLVRIPKVSFVPGSMSADLLRKHCDILVIPAANQINPNFNMDYWTDFIEEIDLPCVVLGLGAQSDKINSSVDDFKYTDSVIRFAKCISKRTDKIGVRGEYTKKILSRIGVQNTVVVGCPSQTLNNNIQGRTIFNQLQKALAGEVNTFALLGGTLQDYTRSAEKRLFELFFNDRKALIVFQTERRILNFIHSGRLDEEARTFLNWHHSIVLPNLSTAEYFHCMASRGRVYSDARSWIDGMRKVDLAIGMRIHGAMAAIQAGRLGICIAFDSRTLELAQTMAIPYISAEDMAACSSIKDVIRATIFSPDEFDSRRAENISRIKGIIPNLLGI